MGKRIVLAVAGAGKTYKICETLNPEKNNLILAYTHENVKNLVNGLKHFLGYIPSNTHIMTFDSFIYRYMINPYLPSICDFFNVENGIKGITIKEPPQQSIIVNGYRRKNPYYHTKEKFEHYYNSHGLLYNEYLPDLLMFVKNKDINLVKKACMYINEYFDEIFVDEFQDFRETKYKLITEMAKYLNNIMLVGDFYQHSVSGTNNSGIPFKKNKLDVDYNDFLDELKKMKFDVDDTSLVKTRRCSKNVSDYVHNKIGINFSSYDDHSGNVIILNDNNEIKNILDDDNIIKLVYENAKNMEFNALNWSYSKGDTFEDVCVILTKSLANFTDDTFDSTKISIVTKNKLYVALTRPKRNLYIIPFNLIKTIL